jgi:hypothetical protein
MKRFMILALALMAFVAPLATSFGVASASYSDDQKNEQAP